MCPIDYFSESFDTLRKQKMCTLLTMLDISVGVFTVMATLGIGAGARIAIENQIASLGSNLVAFNSGPPPSLGRQPIPLYLSDARAILQKLSRGGDCRSVLRPQPSQQYDSEHDFRKRSLPLCSKNHVRRAHSSRRSAPSAAGVANFVLSRRNKHEI